jgi:23S rRNA U2552 (ribose-2'-O)-methylase RlmE/FtsJ
MIRSRERLQSRVSKAEQHSNYSRYLVSLIVVELHLQLIATQIDSKYRLFRAGQTVVDLVSIFSMVLRGWCCFLNESYRAMHRVLGLRYMDEHPSHLLHAAHKLTKVALSRTQPNGRVLGVDIIPASPPKGMSTIQGNFLSPDVQAYVQDFLRDKNRGRPRLSESSLIDQRSVDCSDDLLLKGLESQRSEDQNNNYHIDQENGRGNSQDSDRTVDVVLSDMSAPWVQTRGFWKRSLSNPYHRMMNTSGVSFRDHAGSMVWALNHRMETEF